MCRKQQSHSPSGRNKQNTAPSGGTIDKTATGELTGIFRDSATNLIWQVVAEPTFEELADATALACQKVVEAGITSVDWIILQENELALIQTLHAQGKLPIRVNVIVPFELLKAASGFTSDDPLQLRLGGAIIFADGYLDSKTAALSSNPTVTTPNNNGKMNYAPSRNWQLGWGRFWRWGFSQLSMRWATGQLTLLST